MAKKKTTVTKSEEIATPEAEITEVESVPEIEITAESEAEAKMDNTTEVESEVKSEEASEVKEEAKVELPKGDVEELLLKYIDNKEGEEVELNEFFNQVYAKESSYTAAKLSKQMLVKLSFQNKIKMFNTNWNDLDMHYYEESGKSKKYVISDIKILVKK